MDVYGIEDGFKLVGIRQAANAAYKNNKCENSRVNGMENKP